MKALGNEKCFLRKAIDTSRYKAWHGGSGAVETMENYFQNYIKPVLSFTDLID
jgi:hypothetical protein